MKFIYIDNYENINCYFITALQILHSSETLTKLINEGEFNNIIDKEPILMNPLLIYSKMEGDESKIYDDIKNSIHENKPLIRDGYNWLTLLNCFYFPIFYNKLNKDKFYKILYEMSIEPRQIYDNKITENKQVITNEQLKTLEPYITKYNNDIYKIIDEYNNYISDKKLSYTITALEMYIDDKYGHVMPILRDNKTLYVMDDHHITPLYNHFIKYHRILSDKLRLYYFDENLIKLYNDNLKTNTGFVKNNYSYVFRKFNVFVENMRNNQQSKPLTQQGSNNDKQQEINNIDNTTNNITGKIIISLLSVAVIVLCIVLVIYYKKRNIINNNYNNYNNYNDDNFNDVF